ncbi:hypothetical protein [Paenibacillus harenae]|uniref:DUF4375 domain-containing protein n=1 Tax=Paenibacillus harenae TaxID=306543 RepID=A0ABT9U193_PAEHA|nr:hypothetical protein [Paenibacillus harenae]MDQ0112450.1 hypothetical protein [Paenibacillus harenae]
MLNKRRIIRIDAEGWAEDVEDAQVNVVVIFPNRTTWISNFYTYKCINSMREDYEARGVCLSGAYWCASSPVILVDSISRERIVQVVDELIDDNTFEYVFDYFGPVQERDLERTFFPDNFFDEGSNIEASFVYQKASLVKEMLDQLDSESRLNIMKDVFGLTQ